MIENFNDFKLFEIGDGSVKPAPIIFLEGESDSSLLLYKFDISSSAGDMAVVFHELKPGEYGMEFGLMRDWDGFDLTMIVDLNDGQMFRTMSTVIAIFKDFRIRLQKEYGIELKEIEILPTAHNNDDGKKRHNFYIKYINKYKKTFNAKEIKTHKQKIRIIF